MLYLLHEAPPEEQNFSMIMEMLGSAQVKEDDEEYQSPLDMEQFQSISGKHHRKVQCFGIKMESGMQC